MVERYPHTLILRKRSDYIQSNGGYFEAGTTLLNEMTIQGRVVELGAGPGRSMIGVSETGDNLVPTLSVSLPLMNEDFSGGTVTWEGRTYNIAKFKKSQERCKIWI